jgi:hypothetical protein
VAEGRVRAARAALGALILSGASSPWPSAAELRFEERSARWGVEVRHHHGGSGRRYMVETMVGGVVVFDYDEDGDDDLFFVDGAALPGYEGEAPRSRLLRNDGGRFVDVTGRARVTVDGYGSGATAADVDGDGDRDLYVTCFGPNRLLRNKGDGTFVDVTGTAEVGDPRWSAAAAFGDTDRDGDLDLYVANYVDFTLETAKDCREPKTGLIMYCHPESYRGVPDRFYRNRGDGSFEDATAAAGLGGDLAGAGLGVLFADVDVDGWPDLYVANDTQPNYFYANRGDGTFEDRSFLSGTAVGDQGEPEAGMGVDAGDVDGDGLLDLVVTNFERETNALYRNLGGGLFVDARYATGVAESSLRKLAFGVELADLDNDGDLDLAIANGHVSDNASDLDPSSRYAQANQVLENVGGRFREVPDAGLAVVRASRGLAAGDLDRDGDVDLVVVDSNAPVELYENVGRNDGGWLQLDLVSVTSAPHGVGARLTVLASGRRQVEEVRTAASYLSQSSMVVHFGVGPAEAVESLAVSWPSGWRQLFERLPVRRRVRLREPARPPGSAPSAAAQALEVGGGHGVAGPQLEHPLEQRPRLVDVAAVGQEDRQVAHRRRVLRRDLEGGPQVRLGGFQVAESGVHDPALVEGVGVRR